jgi:hypothetical protein
MNGNFQKHINNLVVLLIVVGYFHIFRVHFIPNSIRLLYQMAMLAMMVSLLLVRSVYHPGPHIKMHFAGILTLLIISAIPSLFVANIYHNQSFLASFYTDRQLLFYLLYFYLHLYKVDYRYVQKLIIAIGVLAIALYFIQLTIYPTKLLDIGVLEGRGTIRLFVAGMLCTQAAYFYFLNQFFAKNKPIYLFLAVLAISIFILQGTRQLIFGMAFLTLMNLMFTRRIRSKFLITVVLSLALVAVFFVFREIFVEITKVSTHQAKNIHGGIRLRAARYFLFQLTPNGWAYIFGNGDAGMFSPYELKMMFNSVKYGYYISDIGVLGDYIKYGIVFAITGLVLLGKALTFKIDREYLYLKYYILSQCFTLITGNGIFSGTDIVFVMILYILDVQKANRLQRTAFEESEEEPAMETQVLN